MSHFKKSENSFLLSLTDLFYIFKTGKRRLIKGAAIGCAVGLLFALFASPKYTAEATFYEKAKSDSVDKNGKSAALLLLGEEKESSAVVMLKSQKIVEDAVKKLNLHAKVQPYSYFPRFMGKIYDRLTNPLKNLSTQWAYLTRSVYPLDLHKPSELLIKDVVYAGEVPLRFDIRFTSSKTFIVKDSGRVLGEGSIGTPFIGGDAGFTLEPHVPMDLNGRRYELTIRPARKVAAEIVSRLKVISDYKDKAFITLTLTYETRRGASSLLNAIMEAYRDYLADEHHRIVAGQVAYLKQRRESMEGQLETLMHEHAEQLSAHAGHLDVLIATQQELQKKLLATDLEIKHTRQAMGKGSYLQAHYISENDPPFIHQTVAEIRQLRQQSSSIRLALNELPKENLFRTEQEFQGIDLETANALYSAYSRELQETEVNAMQNLFVIDKIRQPGFEISSLASLLTDAVSGEIVKKAGTLTLAMKDRDNRTQRELERLNQDLDLQRNFLISHLEQIVDLLKLRSSLLYSKIQAVQEVSLGLLQQKVSLHEQQLQDYASSRLESLKQERELIGRQKQVLQSEFEKLPSQWASEKLLDLYLTRDGALMQHLGSLIESKNIADHLEISLSAPFDYGIPPLHPKSPHLIIFGLLGALAGAFGVAVFALMNTTLSGIEATKENVRLAGAYVAGTISRDVCSSNGLETLRYLISFFGQGRSIAILESTGPRYAEQMASLLGKRGLKTLLMEISFDRFEKEKGLSEYLEGVSNELNVIRKENFDFVPAGGKTAYGIELIESPAFRRLLHELLSTYDRVLAVSRASPCTAEAEGIVSLFDCVAVTVTKEKLQDLEKYIDMEKPCAFLFES